MKLPRGFGKNYFTLSAITATTNTITLQRIATRVQNFHLISFALMEEETQEKEEDALLRDLILLHPSFNLSLYTDQKPSKSTKKPPSIQEKNTSPP